MIKKLIKIGLLSITVSFALLFSLQSYALVFKLPAKGNDIVGQVKTITTEAPTTFSAIGLKYDVGYYELVEANPDLNPNAIPANQKVLLPLQYILPPGKRQGVVINLAELRLFCFLPKKGVVITDPVGIGRQGWETPLGQTKIIQKQKHPYWFSPKSVREWRAKQGVILPKMVPPGPNNPLGDYALRLGWHNYLIHGTNEPAGVGRRVSSGCIRMYPDDIEQLFKYTKVGTKVRIVDEPYLLGWENQKLYLEVHLPLQEDTQHVDANDDVKPVMNSVIEATMKRSANIDWGSVQNAALAKSGVPQLIGEAYSVSKKVSLPQLRV